MRGGNCFSIYQIAFYAFTFFSYSPPHCIFIHDLTHFRIKQSHKLGRKDDSLVLMNCRKMRRHNVILFSH